MLKKAVPRESTIGQNILANGGPSVQPANKNTDIAPSKSAAQIVLPDDSAVHFVQPADADGEKMSTNMRQQVQPKSTSSAKPTKGIKCY